MDIHSGGGSIRQTYQDSVTRHQTIPPRIAARATNLEEVMNDTLAILSVPLLEVGMLAAEV